MTSENIGSDKVLVRREEQVGYITFNNPERRNAMSLDMWRTTRLALEDFASDCNLRAVVLAGAGEKAFVSGADISEFDTQRHDPAAQAQHDATVDGACDALLAVPVPVIAKIRGWCMGGGMGLALTCDLRVCSSDSRFGTPAAKLGVGYAYKQLKQLADHVGYSAAREILFTGMHYSAAEALRMGLVNRVVEAAEFDDFTTGYVARIVEGAPLTIAASKLIIAELAKNPDERDMARCRAAVVACDSSADFIEGRRAFMEKRKPVFTGR